MKNIKLIVTTCFLLLISMAYPQQNITGTVVKADSLSITCTKTTSVVFPYAIKSVDRGSLDILVQKAKGFENVLQVKAAVECFTETNLTVITSDGKLYSFLLNYNEQPKVFNIQVTKSENGAPVNAFSFNGANAEELKQFSTLALAHRKKLRGVKDYKSSIRFRLTGLFIHEGILYYRITIKNDSNINYDIEQLRFFIRDQKKAKRTASQEIELTPVYVDRPVTQVKGNSQNTVVYALPKFTIPDKKYMAIQLMEKNGGRHLELKVKNKTILNSVLLEPINAGSNDHQ
ncbi:conjugative transposon protein TraN [Flavobacterium rivuli WB 3.3-2 = DSM 21788]|uniref:Conjugative transposon protein TraN n=1 Tax=Flavobacterium rivuli WB 3.3-2 = DSM 21788 TaxID=1121895 RepID=A0A0A2LZR7_9FLAO|nr:conjugative transposon protein TraN [Flavobacterium rivuli]KGO85877.1 conjugative transposon protein TraN [Flavobacterium rivuli WB 3.3-2 = DSM 21788]